MRTFLTGAALLAAAGFCAGAKTVVFWQAGFPTIGSQPVSRDVLVKALDDPSAVFAGLRPLTVGF